jgi:nucleoside-diphosphate-sugar epimerase
VFHVAAKAGVWGPASEFHHTNVVGTRNVIAACTAASVEALVYTSSPSVVFDGKDMEGVDESVPYPDRYPAPYPQTKAQAEREVVTAAGTGLKTIVLRPHLIWGPGDNHLVPRIIGRARHLRRVGDGRNLVDTVYIDNAADAHILAAEVLKTRPELSGRKYFISQGEPMPLWEMINAILEAAGLPPVRKSISLRTARRLGGVMEILYRFLRLENEPPMTRFVAEELATSHWFDIGAARRDLGYRPVVSTAEGLLRLARWLDPSRSKGSKIKT